MSMNAVIAGVVILVVAGDMAGLYWFARRFGAFAPVRPETTAIASSSVDISTKPNPRERPVSRSMITFADVTVPNGATAACNVSSVVEYDKPPK